MTTTHTADDSPPADPVELELGISTYLSPNNIPGFSAVLKARYSDFVVHEVGANGEIARLESMEPRVMGGAAAATEDDLIDDSKKKRKRSQSSDEEETPAALDWTKIEEELQEFIGKDATESVVSFLQHTGDSKEHFIKLPPLAEKAARRNLHQWIRSRLTSIAVADTIDQAVVSNDSSESDKPEKIIRIWHKEFESKMPNYNQFERGKDRRQHNRNQQPRPPPGKKYLQFVLYKENMDTGTAINQLQRRCSRQKKKLRMGYAGMKDKRGVTSQFVTVPAHTPIASLCSWNVPGEGGGHTKSAGKGVIRVGNFEYVADELRLGRLQGNRFDIALRNIQIDGEKEQIKASLESAAMALRQSGFINYFGVQRFGKFHDTHLTGMAVLKGDYEKAIEIIMAPKPDEKENVTKAREEWRDRFNSGEDRATSERDCARRIAKEFGRYMNSETAILGSLERHPLDYKRAFSCISKTMRMMFVHALQSYFWNHVASFRIEKMGRSVVKGDLVCSEERDSAVRVVTDEDVAASRYSMEDIVLPLIGTKTRYPENESGKLFDKLLEDKGLTIEVFGSIQDRDMSCTGDYRKVICHSPDVDFKIVEYTDSLQPLLQTDLMKLNGIQLEEEPKDGESKETLLAMNIGFTLPSSSYATVALRELMKRPTSSDYQGALKLDNDSS